MNKPTDYDVVVVGDYFLDLVFANIPEAFELGKEVYAGSFAMIPGGSYNTVHAAHNLGLKVGWAGDFGNDDFSKWILDHARQDGLDDSLFRIHNTPLRRITVSASYPHDRGFLTYCDPSSPIPTAIRALTKIKSTVIYIPGVIHGLAFDIGKIFAEFKNIKIVMDGNLGGTDKKGFNKVRKTLSSLAIFFCNRLEAQTITGEADFPEACRLLMSSVPLLVVKDGANGAMAYLNRKEYYAPAIPVNSIDTTGAGDCFNAGFLKAWLAGKNLEECLQWGNIVGGISTIALGGTGIKITQSMVVNWLAYYLTGNRPNQVEK